MFEAISAVLVYAVGVGLSPVPIIAVILMLFSERARVNGPLFLVGWVVGLAVLFGGVYLLADAFEVGASEAADDSLSWLRIGLGVLLLVGAGRKWRARTKPGDQPTMPAWMSRVERFTPVQALGAALVLSANPKNLVLAIGAGASVAQLGVSTGEAVAAGAAFVVIGSTIVIVAVAYDLVGGDRARASLDELKSWLTFHNSAVMSVLFLVFAAVLISQGLGLRS